MIGVSKTFGGSSILSSPAKKHRKVNEYGFPVFCYIEKTTEADPAQFHKRLLRHLQEHLRENQICHYEEVLHRDLNLKNNRIVRHEIGHVGTYSNNLRFRLHLQRKGEEFSDAFPFHTHWPDVS